jgi:hypothetical protein
MSGAATSSDIASDTARKPTSSTPMSANSSRPSAPHGTVRQRDESRRRRRAIAAQFSTARPGCGHRALAGPHRAGKVAAVIPQTIDNLLPMPPASRTRSGHAAEQHHLRNLARPRPSRRARPGAPAARGRRPVAGLRRMRGRRRDGDDFLRPGNARGADAARPRGHIVLRFVSRHRFLAGVPSGGRLPADGEAGRRPTGRPHPPTRPRSTTSPTV